MNKLLYFLLFTMFALQACNNNTEQTQASQSSEKETDQSLLKDAQEIFKSLPDVAENQENPLTADKIFLGKVLYHDARLSKTGKNSCASCHNLKTYGVDNLPTSPGDAGANGTRNSPTVLNAAFHAMQFWDGRAKDVEEQAGGPILNPVEMNIPSKEFLVNRLKGIKEYQALFAKAFPDDKTPLTYDNVQKAIGAFERTLVTPSAFDEFLNGKIDALSDRQKSGLREFMNVGCQTCHSGIALGGTMLQKFGVFHDYWTLTNSKNIDKGRFDETKEPSDEYVFVTQSLRNITETHPYFHDGSVQDLKDAVKIMAKAQLNKDLTDEQVEDITEFLKSLTGKVPDNVTDVPEWVVQVK